MSMTSIAQSLQAAQRQGLDRLDAHLLLLHSLGKSDAGRAWLVAHDTDALSPEQQSRFAALCQRRQAGEPVAYILGQREFFGMCLQVDSRVLDPRPDTETLVDWALDLLPAGQAAQVLDLGTGSGAIALAIAKHRPQVSVTAVDASPDALAVAKANAQRLHINVAFAHGSWFTPVQNQRFDLIVSNPPYIREADPHMAALTHEPRMALTSGESGLDAIEHIVQHAAAHLQTGGWLLLEHGYDQAASVAALLKQAGFDSVDHRIDLGGVTRCTGGRYASEK
jgi:release factor glutamine methyltransferase